VDSDQAAIVPMAPIAVRPHGKGDHYIDVKTFSMNIPVPPNCELISVKIKENAARVLRRAPEHPIKGHLNCVAI
jgi:hypothetical protein